MPKKLMILFLDDSKHRCTYFEALVREIALSTKTHITLSVAEDADKAKYLLGFDRYDLVALDHDLCELHYNAQHKENTEGGEVDYGDVPTGLDVAKHLVALDGKVPPVCVSHSMNTAGRMRIALLMGEQKGCQVVHFPFDLNVYNRVIRQVIEQLPESESSGCSGDTSS